MEKQPRIPVEVKRFVAAMLGIILFIALAAVVVDVMFGQY